MFISSKAGHFSQLDLEFVGGYMRIWLLKTGEPLPSDGGNVRLMRTGILATMLAQQGHEVVWWASTFDHSLKRHRFHTDKQIEVEPRLTIRLIHSRGYDRNISLDRIVDHREVARGFLEQAKGEEWPDLVLACLPTLDLSSAAVSFARSHGIPCVIDIRDLWPDVFLQLGPRWLQPLTKMVLSPLGRQARSICSGATAILGITPNFVQWGLAHSGRNATRWDRDFPLGYDSRVPSQQALEAADMFWTERGIGSESGHFVVCFFGTLGHQFDLSTVIEAARLLDSGDRRIKFVICGDGDRRNEYEAASMGLNNIVFPGRIGAAEIWVLMRRACVGLAPYYSTPNFVANLPNKPIEYLSAGLPVVSSLKGALRDLLSEFDCGVTYENGTPTELVHVLCKLYDDYEARDRMSKNAYTVYSSKFVAQTVYGEMISHLERLALVHTSTTATQGYS